MCEPQSRIKLCTCGSAPDAATPMWILYRPSEQRFIKVGSYLPSETSGSFLLIELIELILSVFAIILLSILFFVTGLFGWTKDRYFSRNSKKILKDLNEVDVFDFSYQPLHGDLLAIHLQNNVYIFEYSVLGWARSRAKPAALLSAQMSKINNGIIID